MSSTLHCDFQPLYESEEEQTICQCLIELQELRQTIKILNEEIEIEKKRLRYEIKTNGSEETICGIRNKIEIIKWQITNRKRDIQISYRTISQNIKGWESSFDHHIKDYEKSFP